MPQAKIDVHVHYLPEVYSDALVAAGQTQPDGIPRPPEWNETPALDAMNKFDVRHATLPISSPGVHFGDPAAALELARAVHEARRINTIRVSAIREPEKEGTR
jgi:hypothetical protein